MHYIGEGRWAVGVVEENAYRRKVGGERKKNAAIQGAPRKFRMAKLTYRGYQHFAFYDVESPINLLKAVPEFRRADWLYRTNREQAFKESSSASFGIRNRSSDEEFMEEIEQRISAAYPYLFKGRRHFRQPGLGG